MREDFGEPKRDDSGDQTDSDARPRPTFKAARFDDDVTSPISPRRVPFTRTETFESDSISIADDEDDYYDWSGEDDLVDEQAKFAQSMGIARQKRWGFRK